MPIDTNAITAAVEDLQVLVRGDGADIELVRVDVESRYVELSLDLSKVECLDCVIPPHLLADMVTQRIQDRAPGYQVVVRDPRDVAAS
jgi:hypothetical protein